MDNSVNKPSVMENIESDDKRVVDALEAENKHAGNPDLDINKIRDRTFNKELSDLVDKIKSNEETDKEVREDDSSQENAEESVSEEKLLLLMHKLFYKAVNLAEIETINTEFNPFTLYKESSLDDLDIIIRNEMQHASLPEYAVLNYNIKKKCYTCHVNHIKGLSDDNIILETTEKLFLDIIENNNVYILDNLSIERDIYLRKRFTPDTDQERSNFLFIPFTNLFRVFLKNNESEDILDLNNKLLPLIMIRLDYNMKDHLKNEIFDIIKSKMTIYFFLLYKKSLMDIQKNQTVNIENVIAFIDFEFKKYHSSKDDICTVIKFKNYLNMEFLYIFEYLYIKLKQKIGNPGSVSRIEKDRIIIFAHSSKRKTLEKVLEDFNRIYGNIFHFRFFSGEELNRRNVGLYLLFQQ